MTHSPWNKRGFDDGGIAEHYGAAQPRGGRNGLIGMILLADRTHAWARLERRP
jgi:hypothetical protein